MKSFSRHSVTVKTALSAIFCQAMGLNVLTVKVLFKRYYYSNLKFKLLPKRPPYLFPAKIGFDALLLDERVNALSKIKTVIGGFIEARNVGSKRTHDASRLVEGREQLKPIPRQGHLIYSVPGSGKTRLIESLLSKHWGFYFIASNLRPHRSHRSVDDNSENIYTARREGYSKDLYYLWKLVQLHHKTFPGEGLRHKVLGHWLSLLFYSRFLILNAFIEKIGNSQNAPELWLQFQKEKDPFSALFWLLVVHSPSFSERDLRDKFGAFLSQTSPFLICLDEAQMDLDATVHLETGTQSFFQLFVGGTAWLFLLKVMSSPAFVVSGTSLRLEEIKAELKEGIQSSLVKFKPYTDFPLLITDESFEQLLIERDFPLEGTNDRQIKTVVLGHSRRFRGRYLWSVLYIDSLKRQSQKISDAQNLDQVISEAANRVTDRAKKDLKEHLNNIRDLNLRRYLCWIVVCCEILDRKRVIAEDEDNRLIEEGFATVCKESKDGRPKGSLEENLAMEAAIEWFRDENPRLMERTMKQLLLSYAVDDSSFGKASEWFLAWVRLDSLLVLIFNC